MNLRLVASLALAGGLAGCANVKDIRERDPVFFGSSARSAEQYTTCVDKAWQGIGTVAERHPVRNGYELIVQGTMGVNAVLTATTWKGTTEVRLSTRVARYSTALAEAANLCL